MNAQPLGSGSPLQFTDSAGCRRWLDQLNLTNVQLTQQVLSGQLAGLAAASLPPLERLRILEILREPVRYVQTESAKRYAGRPLPLDAGETAAWNNVMTLWQELSRNYQQCLKSYREGELSIAPHAALVTMRCIRLAGFALLDYYRVYRRPPGALWRTVLLVNFAFVAAGLFFSMLLGLGAFG